MKGKEADAALTSRLDGSACRRDFQRGTDNTT
jgi:hypothetical protein